MGDGFQTATLIFTNFCINGSDVRLTRSCCLWILFYFILFLSIVEATRLSKTISDSYPELAASFNHLLESFKDDIMAKKYENADLEQSYQRWVNEGFKCISTHEHSTDTKDTFDVSGDENSAFLNVFGLSFPKKNERKRFVVRFSFVDYIGKRTRIN